MKNTLWTPSSKFH